MKAKKIKAWHFVAEDRKLSFGSEADRLIVEPGFIYTESDPPAICKSGLHGSIRAYDALDYAPGPIICRVQLWGDVEMAPDKLVARNREVLWMADAAPELRLWACWAIRKVWHLLVDQRSRTAVEVAERFARGVARLDDLAAARDAARKEAWTAAAAAAAATARALAWHAAPAAAWTAAAGAERAAAWKEAGDAQALELERRMERLVPGYLGHGLPRDRMERLG